MQFHKYSLSDIEELLPFEKQIYVSMLMQHIKEENEKLKAKQQR